MEPRTEETFSFRFTPAYRVAGLPFGITPATSHVHLGPHGLRVRYGPWSLRTPLENLVDARPAGGFTFLKTAGPPHLSFSDRGVSFTPNADAAVCLTFHRPVAGIDPTRVIKHPGATLGVADVEGLLQHLGELGVRVEDAST